MLPNQARKVPKIISCMIQNNFDIYNFYINIQFIIKFSHKIKEAYTNTNIKKFYIIIYKTFLKTYLLLIFINYN